MGYNEYPNNSSNKEDKISISTKIYYLKEKSESIGYVFIDNTDLTRGKLYLMIYNIDEALQDM